MKKSENATVDSKCVEVIKDANSSQRDKDKAFSTLYARHNNGLFYKFVKAGIDKETAEDLVSETFRKVYTGIKKYDEKFAFSTWMYKIATNTLIDHKRKGIVEQLSIDKLSEKTAEEYDGLSFELKSDILNPEQQIIQDEKVAGIHEAIDSIENKLVRDVMIARYVEDLSFEETAKKLGIDDNSTLRVSAKRGREAIKKKLKKA